MMRSFPRQLCMNPFNIPLSVSFQLTFWHDKIATDPCRQNCYRQHNSDLEIICFFMVFWFLFVQKVLYGNHNPVFVSGFIKWSEYFLLSINEFISIPSSLELQRFTHLSHINLPSPTQKILVPNESTQLCTQLILLYTVYYPLVPLYSISQQPIHT